MGVILLINMDCSALFYLNKDVSYAENSLGGVLHDTDSDYIRL